MEFAFAILYFLDPSSPSLRWWTISHHLSFISNITLLEELFQLPNIIIPSHAFHILSHYCLRCSPPLPPPAPPRPCQTFIVLLALISLEYSLLTYYLFFPVRMKEPWGHVFVYSKLIYSWTVSGWNIVGHYHTINTYYRVDNMRILAVCAISLCFFSSCQLPSFLFMALLYEEFSILMESNQKQKLSQLEIFHFPVF